MRRRRVIDDAQIPPRLNLFSPGDWPTSDPFAAVGQWHRERIDWFASQNAFPRELCDGVAFGFSGTATEWFAARDGWEAQHATELPDWDLQGVPVEPFDPRDL